MEDKKSGMKKFRSVKEGLDPVDKKQAKGKFDDRDDKDLDNDGDVDNSDEYLHKRRKAVSKAVKESIENIDESTSGLKTWTVYISNNYYNGKYADYSSRPFHRIAARTKEEAKQVVIDNSAEILDYLLSLKGANNRAILPKNSAIPITSKEIGRIEPGDKKGRISTFGKSVAFFTPSGQQMFKVSNGVLEESVDNIDEASGFDRASKAPMKRVKIHTRNARRHLKDIEAALTNFERMTSPDWGDVGSVNHITAQLGELADRLAARGEYARENRVSTSAG